MNMARTVATRKAFTPFHVLYALFALPARLAANTRKPLSNYQHRVCEFYGLIHYHN